MARAKATRAGARAASLFAAAEDAGGTCDGCDEPVAAGMWGEDGGGVRLCLPCTWAVDAVDRMLDDARPGEPAAVRRGRVAVS